MRAPGAGGGRHDAGRGRRALVCLGTLDAALLGEGSSDWARLGDRLQRAGLLEPEVLPRVLRQWWFGRFIANTDMHTGNLSFVPRDGRLGLAPAYDQLPMLYAPQPGGEVPPRRFDPPMPLPVQRDGWLQGCKAAVGCWRRAGADERISPACRQECGVNAERLLRVAERV